ncbi:MAG: class I SAM-dependent methyltransferase [Pyrinomonadaceae bacterium]
MSKNLTVVPLYHGWIVAQYFSNLSVDPFLHYFFNERLDEAVRGLDFEGKTILDIGAGTGNLFDRISSEFPDPDYYACDIAEKMLGASRIPADRRFVGACHQIEWPRDRFDIVYMLGVTTYLDPSELEKTLRFVHDVLEDDGEARITFTNSASLDWKFRKALKSVARLTGSKKLVLSQDFNIYPFSLKDLPAFLFDMFSVKEVVWLNHTVFPFYKVGGSASVSLARRFHESGAGDGLRGRLSSDFMLRLSRKNLG